MKNFLSLSHKFTKQFATMKHFYCNGFGDVSVLKIKESEIPVPKQNEVLFKIKATGLNRADLLQRQGKYPPPKGTTDILGLEASGYVLDSNMKELYPACCLLSGGGYAQYTTVNKNHIIPLAKNINVTEGASIAEAWLTAYMIIKYIGQVQKGQNVLIYAGASGVGTAAIQLANLFGANPIVSCSSQRKVDQCLKIGAKFGINYKVSKYFERDILKFTQGKGINLVLDCVGPSNIPFTQNLLGMDGKWILYGLLSGAKADKFNLVALLNKRISLIATTLRNRNDDYKADLIKQFCKDTQTGFEQQQLKPVIDQIFNISWNQEGEKQMQSAHKHMESNNNIGKIILNFE